MCPNYEPEGQGRGSTFRVCHALKKIAILLNKSLIPSHLKWPALYTQSRPIARIIRSGYFDFDHTTRKIDIAFQIDVK